MTIVLVIGTGFKIFWLSMINSVWCMVGLLSKGCNSESCEVYGV